MDTIIRNGKLVIPKVGIVDGDIAIENGKIAAILSPGTACEAETVIDASGKYVFPGCIDPHVHWGCYQDMGVDTRMESAAAAIGGYTTCLQYRRTPGPNFEPQYVQQLLDVMTPNSYIDYGLQLFITKQDHKNTVDLAVKEMGVSSFKFFTTERNVDVDIRGLRDSGIPEPYTDGFMYESMQELAKYDGNVVANFHPENIELVVTVAPKVKAAGEMGLAAWDHVRPEIAEAETVSRLSYFSEKTGCPLYCVHISCAEAAEKIAQGKKTNLRLYGETTPHYLVLNTDSPCAELGKVNPPLREAHNNDKLWQYLADGTLDTVAPTTAPTSVPTRPARFGMPPAASTELARCSPSSSARATIRARSVWSASRRSPLTMLPGSSTCPKKASSSPVRTPISSSSISIRKRSSMPPI